MLRIESLSYGIGDRQILNEATFTVSDTEKAAIVGPNGAGKTTLLKIIVGDISPDEGVVYRPDNIGYIPQHLDATNLITKEDMTIEEFMLEGRGLDTIAHDLVELTTKMGTDISPSEMKHVLKEYGSLMAEFESRGGYESVSEIEKILGGINLDIDIHRTVETLSGGEKSRLAFARGIFTESDLLILDEPTNHIDFASYSWLGKYLASLKGSVLVVSHHPEFINPFTNKILELEKHTGKIKQYNGSYEDYIVQSEVNSKTLKRQIDWLDKEIPRLEEAARRLQHSGPTKASQAQHILNRVVRLQKERDLVVNDIAQEERAIVFKFPISKRSSRVVVEVSGIFVSYDSRPIIDNLSFVVESGDRLIIDGPNGSGKTTLVRLIVGSTKPTHGSVKIGHNVQIGYYAQEHENLDDNNTVIEEVQSVASMFNGNLRSLLGRFLFPGDKVFQSISTLSMGEKSRLSICKLMVSGHNLLILDEPTNHLDVDSRKAVIKALNEYQGTVIVVSHDKDFVARINPNKTLALPNGDISLYTNN